MSGRPGPVIVLAHWRMDERAVEDVLGLVAELGRPTREEPGCLGYDVFRSVDSPGELLLIERYRDDAAIEAHRASPHYRRLVVERILPRLSDRRIELLATREPG